MAHKLYCCVVLLYLLNYLRMDKTNNKKMLEALNILENSVDSPNAAFSPHKSGMLSPMAQKKLLAPQTDVALVEFYVKKHHLDEDAEELFFKTPRFKPLFLTYLAKWYVGPKGQSALLELDNAEELIKALLTDCEPEMLIEPVKEYVKTKGWTV